MKYDPRFDPMLKGSRESLDRQHATAQREGLTYASSRSAILNLKSLGALVPLTQGRGILIDSNLPETRQLSTVAARRFLEILGVEFHETFDSSFKVTSAVRSEVDQRQLRRRNRNATTNSPHLTGAAIDISYKGLTREQDRWLATQLIELEKQGLIEATRERHQRCYHVMVFNKYLATQMASSFKDNRSVPSEPR